MTKPTIGAVIAAVAAVAAYVMLPPRDDRSVGVGAAVLSDLISETERQGVKLHAPHSGRSTAPAPKSGVMGADAAPPTALIGVSASESGVFHDGHPITSEYLSSLSTEALLEIQADVSVLELEGLQSALGIATESRQVVTHTEEDYLAYNLKATGAIFVSGTREDSSGETYREYHEIPNSLDGSVRQLRAVLRDVQQQPAYFSHVQARVSEYEDELASTHGSFNVEVHPSGRQYRYTDASGNSLGQIQFGAVDN